ncbi:hypothetical protein GF314_05510 [bacterium]|nr:hypothetical protein [bacterium]
MVATALTPVHRLNDAGLDALRRYLEDLRQGSQAPPPHELLTDRRHAAPLVSECAVERRDFTSRLDAVRYLDGVLGGIAPDDEDVGLWSWLSLHYFDQVCPVRDDGRRHPGRDYRHILEPGYPHGHRHLVAGPFTVHRLHGDHARALLCSPLATENIAHHEIAARQSILTNRALVVAADRLYFDEARGRLKRGVQGSAREPGTLRRFIAVVQQLEVNYDLYSMTPEAIIGLLPREFDRWRPRQGTVSD